MRKRHTRKPKCSSAQHNDPSYSAALAAVQCMCFKSEKNVEPSAQQYVNENLSWVYAEPSAPYASDEDESCLVEEDFFGEDPNLADDSDGDYKDEDEFLREYLHN